MGDLPAVKCRDLLQAAFDGEELGGRLDGLVAESLPMTKRILGRSLTVAEQQIQGSEVRTFRPVAQPGGSRSGRAPRPLRSPSATRRVQPAAAPR